MPRGPTSDSLISPPPVLSSTLAGGRSEIQCSVYVSSLPCYQISRGVTSRHRSVVRPLFHGPNEWVNEWMPAHYPIFSSLNTYICLAIQRHIYNEQLMTPMLRCFHISPHLLERISYPSEGSSGSINLYNGESVHSPLPTIGRLTVHVIVCAQCCGVIFTSSSYLIGQE